MVLLKNDGALLPLDKARVKTIAVVGHLADADNTGDHGSSRVTPPYYTSALKGLRDYLGAGATVLHANGDGPRRGRPRRRRTRTSWSSSPASRWDEVGEYVSDDAGLRPKRAGGEARRSTIKMPFLKEPFAMSGWRPRAAVAQGRATSPSSRRPSKANPRTVVALVGGSVFTMEEWKNDVPAILMAWYFGMEGGHALARVLFGDVNPSGKMPLTTPKDETQLPFFDEFADSIEYGPYHGYTLFDKKGLEPAFPFGYGLSYTTYAYGNLKVVTPTVAAGRARGRHRRRHEHGPARRRGGRAAVRRVRRARSVDRPVKLLRGFAKVALAPGETKTVPLSVAVKDLAWYDAEKKAWRVEPMTYGVLRRALVARRGPAEGELHRGRRNSAVGAAPLAPQRRRVAPVDAQAYSTAPRSLTISASPATLQTAPHQGGRAMATQRPEPRKRDGAFDAADSAARALGVRMVGVAIDGEPYHVQVPGPPGAVLLDGSAPDLFERLEAEGGFDDAQVARLWLEHARALGTAGVALRKQGRLASAYCHQRVALFVAARAGNVAGAIVSVKNLWVIRDGLRDILVRALGPDRSQWQTDEGRRALAALRWVDATIPTDAGVACRLVSRLVDAVDADASAPPDVVLRLRHALYRVARMAGDIGLRRAALERLLEFAAASGSRTMPLLAAIDENRRVGHDGRSRRRRTGRSRARPGRRVRGVVPLSVEPR